MGEPSSQDADVYTFCKRSARIGTHTKARWRLTKYLLQGSRGIEEEPLEQRPRGFEYQFPGLRCGKVDGVCSYTTVHDQWRTPSQPTHPAYSLEIWLGARSVSTRDHGDVCVPSRCLHDGGANGMCKVIGHRLERQRMVDLGVVSPQKPEKVVAELSKRVAGLDRVPQPFSATVYVCRPASVGA